LALFRSSSDTLLPPFILCTVVVSGNKESGSDAPLFLGNLYRFYGRRHTTVNSRLYLEITKTERTHAKAGNFGISYGGTEYALQTTFKCDYGIRKSLPECAKIIKAVKDSYPRIEEFQRKAELDARETGFTSTIYGYMRLLPDINSADRSARNADARKAMNTPIQGSAADIMKRAQNGIYEDLGKGTWIIQQIKKEIKTFEPGYRVTGLAHGYTNMIAQIHDEVIFEMNDRPELIKAADETIRKIMEEEPFPGCPVPIIAEACVGYSWGKKMSLNDYYKMKEGGK
jgi:DNA polymerase-1